MPDFVFDFVSDFVVDFVFKFYLQLLEFHFLPLDFGSALSSSINRKLLNLFQPQIELL